MVVLAILVSLYCCRKYGNCTPDKSSKFYLEDANENQFAYTLRKNLKSIGMTPSRQLTCSKLTIKTVEQGVKYVQC